MADEVKIIRLVIDSSKAVDGSAAATRALANIDRATSDSANALSRMEQALGRVGGYLKAQLAIEITKIAAHLIEMGKSALDAAANLGELSEQMGITTQGLQALQYSAVQNNLKLEQLETGIAKFSQKIGEAASGSKEMIAAFDNIGVKLLDMHGKLVPTEALLQRTAQAILAIEDPARQVSAAVDVFGKAGAKMLPTLKDIAGGMDELAAKAKAAGTMISDREIAQLDAFADRSSVVALKARAMFAELGAPIATAAMEAVNSLIGKILKGLQALGQFARDQNLANDNRDIAQWDADIAKQSLVAQKSAAALAATSGSAGYHDAYTENLKQQQKLADYRASRSAIVGRRDMAVAGPSQYATELLVSGTAPIEAPAGTGQPVATGGGGESPEAKYAKLTAQLNNAAIAQDRMTAAALQGDQAFDAMKAHLDAQQKTLEIFGHTLDDNDPRLKDLEASMQRIAQGKMKEAFALATTELQKQNDVLAAQVRLFGEAPEVQAKELALIKATNEAKKAGESLDSDAFKARVAQTETNEKLKQQYADLQKAQELWTAPLKSALESIQRIGADAFDKFLENGKFSFDELSKVFTTTLRRMAAEFLALATIRPVMSVLVNAVSPSIAQSMGLGSSGGGLFGGGGSSGISVSGGGGGMFGNIGGFLSSPIMPADPYAGLFGGPTATAGLGGLTWGAGLGALAGAGMGAYQLLSGNGSTSSTIGGISSIIGAGASLIPGIGPILGPAIGLLGNLLPGLFGLDGTKQPIANDTYGQLSYGTGGWYTSGGAWGPDANSSQTEKSLLSTGGSISSIFNLLGGVKNAGSVWGLSSSNTSKTGSGWDFSSTTSSLINPAGGSEVWRMNESDMMNTGAAQVARRSILGGAVGDISENMRKVVQSIGETTAATLEELATAIADVKTFDDAISGLGKTMTDAEKAVVGIDTSFSALYDTADKYGLPVSDLDAAKAKARLGVATDFGKSISRQILDITDPAAGALQDLDAWKQTLIDNNKYLIDNVTGALDQINEIEKLYGLKRAAIVQQSANQALDGLKSALSRMLYGDLSGASPGDALTGAKGTYMATLAQSFAGNSDAAAALGGDAAGYLQAAANYYGTSTSDYQSIRKQTIIDTASAYRISGGSFADIPGGYDVIMGGGGLGSLAAPLAANVNALTVVSGQFVDLNVKIQEVLDAHTEQTNQATEFLELMRRMVAAG